MTKKDFVLIAGVLRQSMDSATDADQRILTAETASNMAQALRGTNPAFQYYTFMAACGVAGY